MLELGAMPNASQLTPARAGASLYDLLVADRAMEARAVEIYREAANYCALINDAVNRELFTTLMNEELGHLRELEQWMEHLRTMAGPGLPGTGA
jgi:bacterioferritin